MEITTVAELIRAALPDADIRVDGDGRHFEAVVTSAAFAGKTPLQRQRMVMAGVQPHLLSGELHALSIKTLLPEIS